MDIFKKANRPFELMHCNSTHPMPVKEALGNGVKWVYDSEKPILKRLRYH